MADYEVCETGLWVDDESLQVVAEAPLTGRLICPPGGFMRPDRVKALEMAKAAALVVEDVAPVAAEAPVEPEADPVEEAEPVKATRARKAK